MAIPEFLSRIKSKLDENKPFPFWEIVSELDKVQSHIQPTSLGKIEPTVVIEGTLHLDSGSVIKSGTRIEGHVWIGENCVIGPNAFLRKTVLIADNCHIGSSEIKNSVILSHSNVPHYSYVGDSIIGEHVNFGAGSKIANLRFDDKTIFVQLNGQKVDTGRRKLGACIGHNVKIGINASINCGIYISNNVRVFPAQLVKKNLE